MDSPSRKYQTVLLFGMPGSGKGTQGMVLGQLPFCVHISMGEVFRKLPKWGKLGREVLDWTSQGKMVPDDLTVRIYERHLMALEMQELVSEKHLLILDGLPRNYEQAQRLDSMLEVVRIFHLVINDRADAMERLKTRALRENRLDDINEDTIRRRLRIYDEDSINTLRFYNPEIITEIEASRPPVLVLREIVDVLARMEVVRMGPLADPSARTVEFSNGPPPIPLSEAATKPIP